MEGDRIVVWPCERGDVLIEPAPVPAHHQCHDCGAKPVEYVRMDAVLEVLGTMVGYDGHGGQYGDETPGWGILLSRTEASEAVRNLNRVPTEGPSNDSDD